VLPKILLGLLARMHGGKWGNQMISEILTWLGVGGVLLLAWSLYMTIPAEEKEEQRDE
jgi:hypothetical protein